MPEKRRGRREGKQTFFHILSNDIKEARIEGRYLGSVWE
jgi:hypothetical protein